MKDVKYNEMSVVQPFSTNLNYFSLKKSSLGHFIGIMKNLDNSRCTNSAYVCLQV